MIINNNMSAMNAHRQMGMNQTSMQTSMEKLSSGQRINRAGDDAAGLAISEKMRAQISGLDQASRNAQDGISLIQTAEGALDESHSILQRMRELAVQSANDTNQDDVDREAIQEEVDALAAELDRIAGNTEFNNKNLLNGSFKGEFHIGANSGQSINVEIGNLNSSTLGVSREGEAEVVTGSVNNDSTVLGVENQNAFVDGNNNVVAVEIGSEWFNVNDVEVDENGSLAAKDGADNIDAPAEVTTHTLNGETYVAEELSSDETVTVDGNNVTVDSGTTVLRNSDDEIIAIQNGSSWYEVSDLEEDTENAGQIDFTESTAGDVTTSTAASVELTTTKGIDVSNQVAADGAIDTINSAINQVSEQRSYLGAIQNRLEHTIANLDNASENLQAAESRVRDVDMAREMMEFTKNNILSQASQSMLAQANQLPQSVLQLLQ
ncbi:flagellin [Geomicrobium sediminis]|uniref:Flagellin n=1 Tax=Geomicrobium sediminis TaxID=1347788 RepID=A0ABS2PBF9_9BACL|nr:flagellin [Geomicrobium sediminis]MBM7632681.1 flagellin [Geomicrobium sediminis]